MTWSISYKTRDQYVPILPIRTFFFNLNISSPASTSMQKDDSLFFRLVSGNFVMYLCRRSSRNQNSSPWVLYLNITLIANSCGLWGRRDETVIPNKKVKIQPTYQFISGNSSAVHLNKISEQTLILIPVQKYYEVCQCRFDYELFCKCFL